MYRIIRLLVKVAVSMVLSILLLPGWASSSGFGIFTQGASALGQAAAVTAHGDSPSMIFFNPALISKLDGTRAEIGTTLLFPSTEYNGANTGQHAGTKDSVFAPSTFFATHRITDAITIGLGVFTPFGLGTDWGETWEGRYLATNSEMITVNANPVAAFRVSPNLAVAAGLDILYLDAQLEKMIPVGAFDVRQKFRGDGTGVGFNVGLLYTPTNKISLGVSYRSEIKVGVAGEGTFDIQIPGTPLTNSPGKTSIRLPQQVSAGISYSGLEPLTIEAGVRWEDWSSFRSLDMSFENGNSISTPKNWKSTFAYNIGARYRINESVSILAGYLFGDNPVPDDTLDPAIPDSDSHYFSVGTELSFGKFRVDLSYAYQLMEDRIKSNLAGGGPIANGKYSSDLHLAAVSLAYSF
jgi:long-chain fatty acid transport protein